MAVGITSLALSSAGARAISSSRDPHPLGTLDVCRGLFCILDTGGVLDTAGDVDAIRLRGTDELGDVLVREPAGHDHGHPPLVLHASGDLPVEGRARAATDRTLHGGVQQQRVAQCSTRREARPELLGEAGSVGLAPRREVHHLQDPSVRQSFSQLGYERGVFTAMQLHGVQAHGHGRLHDLVQGLVHEDAYHERRPLASDPKLCTPLCEALDGGECSAPRPGRHNALALAKAPHDVDDGLGLLHGDPALGLGEDHANHVRARGHRATRILLANHTTHLDDHGTGGHGQSADGTSAGVAAEGTPHEFDDGSTWVRRSHQCLANEDTATRDVPALLNIFRRAEAAQCQYLRAVAWTEGNLEGLAQRLCDQRCRLLVQLERVEISVVHTEDLGASVQGDLQLPDGDHLDQGLEAPLAAEGDERAQSALRENGHHEQHRVRSVRNGLQHLVFVDDEVLPQARRPPDTLLLGPSLGLQSHVLQVLERALEPLGLRQDR
mmetsp:Transcript_36935/g.119122  ORF Transcript_36935/g.119122 Transcript_36935/m.119122 type:complete len:494 (+) Transcript_36935:43-1524(+)